MASKESRERKRILIPKIYRIYRVYRAYGAHGVYKGYLNKGE